MKYLRLLCLILAVIMCCSVFMIACDDDTDNDGGSQDGGAGDGSGSGSGEGSGSGSGEGSGSGSGEGSGSGSGEGSGSGSGEGSGSGSGEGSGSGSGEGSGSGSGEGSGSGSGQNQNIVGITFANGSFEYDEEEHSISITGNVPNGASVVYSGGENGRNGATNVGEYTITVTITAQGYNQLTLSAKLTITSREEALSVNIFNNKVYYQNALDGNKLYSYDSVNSNELADRGNVTYMLNASYGGKNYMFFISNNLFSNSISYMDGDGKITDVIDVNAEELISDGTYLYYTVNGLFGADSNGIWRVSIASVMSAEEDEEIIPQRVTSTKAKYLVCVGGYLYFSNASEGGKLYCVSKTANNSSATLIHDAKCTEIIADGNYLYFLRSKLNGAAIYSLDVSGNLHTSVSDENIKLSKLTTYKGKYLTKVGNKIYFVNTDVLTVIVGNGIYSVGINGGPEKVVDMDDIYSLATDGTNIYFYKASNKHLYKYDTINGTQVDLMANFVAPQKNTVITTYYEKSVLHEGEIYYINMLDGGRLYKYNIANDAEYRLIGTEVADFAIHNGYLYYTTVKLKVNFDLYRVSLANGEPERISTDKCMNFSFDGNYMYYTNYSGSNTLNKIDLTTLVDTVIYQEEDVGAAKTVVDGGFVYFEADDRLYRYNISTGVSSMVSDDIDPIDYIIYGGKILVVNEDGTNEVGIYDIASEEYKRVTKLTGDVIVQSDDARGLFVYNGEFYFYRNIAIGSSKVGLYKVTANGSSYEATLVSQVSGKYVCEGIVSGSTLYFIDVWKVKDTVPTPSSTCKLYALNLTNYTVSELN